MIVSGTFISTGSAVKVECGFVPDYIEAYSALGGTELGFRWFKALSGKTGQYGIAIANAGDVSVCADADNGFITYDTYSQGVMLPAPNGNGEVLAALAADFVAGATAPTARSTSVVGTVVRPSVHNGYVYECTVTAGVYGTEPTWGTVVGETTSDGTNTWICRAEKTASTGAKGFQVGATLATDSEIWVFKAEKHDRAGDMGDADSTNPVRLP